jgi:hypothetical protein
MATGWFVKQGDKVFGPFDAPQLRKFAEAKKIGPKTQVSQSSGGPWALAGNLKGLFSADGSTDGPPKSAVSATAPKAATPPRPANSPASVVSPSTTGKGELGSGILFGASAIFVACVAAVLCFMPSIRLLGVAVSVLGVVLGGLGVLLNASASVLPLRIAIGGVAMSLLSAMLGGVLTMTASQAESRVKPQGAVNPTQVAVASTPQQSDEAKKTKTSEKPQESTPAAPAVNAVADETNHKAESVAPERKVATTAPSTDDDPYGWQGAAFGMSIDEVRTALGDRVSDINPPQEWGERYSPIAVRNLELGGEPYVVHLQFGKASNLLEQVLIRETGGADMGKYLSVVKLMSKKYGPPAETTDSSDDHAAIWAFPRMEIKASLQRLPGFTIIAITYAPATGRATTNVKDNL